MKAKKQGISLIVLVITIIVMIILAAAIIITLANNGIIGKASEAKLKTNIKTEIEQVNLAVADALLKGNNMGIIENVRDLEDSLALNGLDDAIAGINSNNGYIVTIGENVYEVSKSGLVVFKSSKDVFLVDTCDIGDYVDIGISYNNTSGNVDFTSDYLLSNDYISGSLVGWRVLSKEGKGETGTVKLISAGAPLHYYHGTEDGSVAIENITDLYKEIELSDTKNESFRANGFNSNNLKTIFNIEYVDITKGVHGVTSDEISSAYNYMTKRNKTIQDIYSMAAEYPCMTATMVSVNNTIRTNAYDLLCNGFTYWLSGQRPDNQTDLYAMLGSGFVGAYYGGNMAIRPVITLKQGIKISSSNQGNGSKDTLAYKITL